MEKSLRINPYTLPEGQHGWRGLSVPGNHKRKWYTIIHNEQVLVTALLLIPGEKSIRHSHESGELSIHFLGELKPRVTWNPPGVLHGPPVKQDSDQGMDEELTNLERSSNPEVVNLVRQISQMQLQIQQLHEGLQRLLTPEPSPRVIVDILFPPFKSTIDDPAYPERKTVIGQWYD